MFYREGLRMKLGHHIHSAQRTLNIHESCDSDTVGNFEVWRSDQKLTISPLLIVPLSWLRSPLSLSISLSPRLRPLAPGVLRGLQPRAGPPGSRVGHLGLKNTKKKVSGGRKRCSL